MTSRASELVIDTVAGMKLLADPLRFKMLDLLEAPRTVRELAEILDRPADRLYYHLRKLEAGGLVIAVDERRVGGVTERTYQSAAERIRLAPDLQTSRPVAGSLMDSALDRVRHELGRAVAHDEHPDPEAPARIALSLNYLHLTEDERAELLGEIDEFVTRWMARSDANVEAGAGTLDQGLSLLTYPLVEARPKRRRTKRA